jgi:hypothetical protein
MWLVAVGEASEAVDKLCGSLSVSELQILCDTLSRFPNDARKRTAVLQVTLRALSLLVQIPF